MIHWPAILPFRGHAGLPHVPEAAWEADPHRQGWPCHPEDFGLNEGLQRTRRHATQDGACRAAKLSATSIAEATAPVA